MHIDGVMRVPGGKTVQVSFEYDNGLIHDTFFSGDFFMEPPEKLRELNRLVNMKKLDRMLLKEIVELLEDADITGASSEDFYTVLDISVNKMAE